MRACSSAWLERFPDKEEVGGSSPPRPTRFRNLTACQIRLRNLNRQENLIPAVTGP